MLDDYDYYLSAPDVQRRFGGISRKTLFRWRQMEGFPEPLTINRRLYFKLDDLRRWEVRNQHRVAGPTAHDRP